MTVGGGDGGVPIKKTNCPFIRPAVFTPIYW